MDRNEIPHDHRCLGVPSGASKKVSEPIVCSVQIMHLCALRLALSPNIPKWASTCASLTRSTIGCIQNFFVPMVLSAQTVHLSCTDNNTVSKQTETSFHLSLLTEEYHRVHPKWFLSLWYVWRKPCTYLPSTLKLSPNKPKRDSTWCMSHRSSIRCVQNDFWAYGMFGANRAPILHQH
jgi:hypothetical protein